MAFYRVPRLLLISASVILCITSASIARDASYVIAQANEDSSNKQLSAAIATEKTQTPEDIATGIMLDFDKGSDEYRQKRDDGNYDSIAFTLEKCVGTGAVNPNLINCYRQAQESYDNLLNEIYQSALEKSNESTKKSLIASQKEWLSFRTAEEKAQSSYRKIETGASMHLVLINKHILAVKERISELVMYLNIGII